MQILLPRKKVMLGERTKVKWNGKMGKTATKQSKVKMFWVYLYQKSRNPLRKAIQCQIEISTRTDANTLPEETA